MSESRPYVYGKFLPHWVRTTINSLPEKERTGYRIRFVDELNKYSFEPRKFGFPRNSGCVNELEGIFHLDIIKNPTQLARIIKEDMHLMYNKDRAKLLMKGLLENL